MKAPDCPNPDAIRLVDQHVDVVVQWRNSVHRESRTFCNMPAVAYDLRDNPLYKQLERKDGQLSGMPAGMLRCVFVMDVGSWMLRHLRPMSGTGQEKGGGEIILHFLQNSRIDIICVFSQDEPHQIFGLPEQPRVKWRVTFFDLVEGRPESFYDGLRLTAAQLPHPRHPGYRARSLHRQGAFGPEDSRGRGGLKIISQGGKMSIEVSARLVQDLLAGIITPEQFQRQTFGDDPNQFAMQRLKGKTLRDVRFVADGIDRDDDTVVFDLATDAAAQKLTPPRPPRMGSRIRAWLSKAVLQVRVATGTMDNHPPTAPRTKT